MKELGGPPHDRLQSGDKAPPVYGLVGIFFVMASILTVPSCDLAPTIALTPCPVATVVPTFAPTATREATPTLKPTARPSAKATNTPPKPTPSPTPIASEREAKALLQLSPYSSCSENLPRCAAVYAVQVLDHLYRYPTSFQRLALITRVLDYAGYGYSPLSLDWLVEDWLDETVRQPFDAAGGLPAGFAEQWQPRGQVTSTDLDDNGDPDYLLTVRFGPPYDVSIAQGLYWLIGRLVSFGSNPSRPLELYRGSRSEPRKT